MAEKETTKLDCCAILELMGHAKIAGRISEHPLGSSVFIRVDVPAVADMDEFTRLFNPGAIYSINPCSEDIMLAIAKETRAIPIKTWDEESAIQKMIADKVAARLIGNSNNGERVVDTDPNTYHLMRTVQHVREYYKIKGIPIDTITCCNGNHVLSYSATPSGSLRIKCPICKIDYIE